jgi:hypothetical protein
MTTRPAVSSVRPVRDAWVSEIINHWEQDMPPMIEFILAQIALIAFRHTVIALRAP